MTEHDDETVAELEPDLAPEREPALSEDIQPEEGDKDERMAKKIAKKKTRQSKPVKALRSAKTPKAPRAVKAPKAPRVRAKTSAQQSMTRLPVWDGPLPDTKDLHLATNGLCGRDTTNRYINLEFDNGYSVRLLPVGFAKGEAKKIRATRDLIGAWLKKHIAT